MEPLPPRLAEIVDDFAALDDPRERFEELIAFGKQLPPLPEALRTPANKVAGCVSNVYVHAALEGGRLRFAASADAHLVRGLVAILVQGLEGLSPTQVRAVDPAALQRAGLLESLTPSRANAPLNILRLMQAQAAALAA